jgi:hypothetical protein
MCQERVALHVFRLQGRDAPPRPIQPSSQHATGLLPDARPLTRRTGRVPLHIVSLMDIRLFIKAALIGIAARTTFI